MAQCFLLYSQKYPDFVHYVDEELKDMKYYICSMNLERECIVVPNPCSHFCCPDCAAELIRRWNNDGRTKKCPMCRTFLLGNFFNKPFSCNMTKSDCTDVFVWVPIGVYINKNYEQELIINLTNDDLHMAFACAFM